MARLANRFRSRTALWQAPLLKVGVRHRRRHGRLPGLRGPEPRLPPHRGPRQPYPEAVVFGERKARLSERIYGDVARIQERGKLGAAAIATKNEVVRLRKSVPARRRANCVRARPAKGGLNGRRGSGKPAGQPAD